jgi:exonuclease SbcC
LNLWEKAEAEYELRLKVQVNAQESYKKCYSNYNETEKRLKKKLEEYFSQENANIIYQKIDPNNDLTDMNISLTFGEDNRLQLSYEMIRKDEREKGYTAEIYLSTAQLNAVAFSSFFARALTEKQVDIHSIIIDDPIGSFDDMNILGFADLIRSIIMHTDVQIIMTTHDSKIFDIMKRKLNEEYHSSRFYRLPDDLETIEVDDPEI